MAQKYNLPDKDDPQGWDKLKDLVRGLLEQQDNTIKSFGTTPSNPEGTRQYGDVWFDNTDHTFKVHTKDGTKTLKYE